MDFGSILEGFWAPNSHLFRYFPLSFFGFIFGSIFLWFFVDFWSLETLKFVLPPAREHNFDKIDVFHFIANFAPKMMVLRGQNPCKIEENRRKKRVSKQVLFKHRFFSFFCRFWFPSWGTKNGFLASFFLHGTQEAPKRPQEASKRGFWKILASILASFWYQFFAFSPFFLCSLWLQVLHLSWFMCFFPFPAF